MEIIPFSRTFRPFLYLSVLLFLSCSTTEWQKVSKTGNSESRFMADITYLADDKLEGRAFGSKGELLAGNYIAKRFDLLELKPAGEKGSWFQSFTVKNPRLKGVGIPTVAEPEKLTGRNVIGFLDSGAPYTIVLGAHYDHLGMGSFGSLYAGDPAIHNGADDNASGVAIILELAQRLKRDKTFNYLFIAFAGEEVGLLGSNYFCEHPTIDTNTITAMLNFDMVGRLNRATNKLALNGTGTSPAWPDLIKAANTYGFDLTLSESGIGPSDHTSFYLEGIPVIHFFTGAHEDYHKPSDDVHYINPAGMDAIASFVVSLIREMDEKNKLEFTKTNDPHAGTNVKMEVTLGVIPDYLYNGKGMRIDGVREGKPAHEAGLVKGDVIIKMGGKEIKDIYSYMEVLGTFHKGDKTQVIAMRDGKEMEIEINF